MQVEKRNDGIHRHIAREERPLVETRTQSAPTLSAGALVLVVPSEFMGRGNAELGQILIRGFFHTLSEVEPLPNVVIFFNSGVRMVAEGSPVLEDLQALCDQGVEILACGTCLGYYELRGQVAVGEVSNMYTIAETLLAAGRVVTL